MNISVDQTRCSGHARCHEAAPDLYELDDDGYAAVAAVAVPAGREAAARAGADACPERAIVVVAD